MYWLLIQSVPIMRMKKFLQTTISLWHTIWLFFSLWPWNINKCELHKEANNNKGGLTPNMQREVTTNYFCDNNSTNVARQIIWY